MKQIIFEELQPKTLIMADNVDRKSCIAAIEKRTNTKYIFLYETKRDKYLMFCYIYNANVIPHMVKNEDGDLEYFHSPFDIPREDFNFFLFDTQEDMFAWLVKGGEPKVVTRKHRTKEDEEKLEFLWKAGKSKYDLAEIFNKSQSAIVQRLRKLELV